MCDTAQAQEAGGSADQIGERTTRLPTTFRVT
jgi:hypothetical protein